MLHAIVSATRSSCLVRQVGAVLVRNKRIITSGYNGAPPDVESCLDTQVCFYQDLAYQDSRKGLGDFPILKEQYKGSCSAIHAEKNAINQCSESGVSARGSILVTSSYPCPGCVRDSIIPNHIAEVVVWKSYLANPLLTMDEYNLSKFWLGQARIPVRKFELSSERMAEIFSLTGFVGERLSYRFDPSQSQSYTPAEP